MAVVRITDAGGTVVAEVQTDRQQVQWRWIDKDRVPEDFVRYVAMPQLVTVTGSTDRRGRPYTRATEVPRLSAAWFQVVQEALWTFGLEVQQ